MGSIGQQTIRTRPLLRRVLWGFWLRLRKALEAQGRQGFFPVFQSKLSLFFDKDEPSVRKDSGFILRESVDLFLVTTPPNSQPIAAFDLLDRDMPHGVEPQKREFFRRQQIPYFTLEPKDLLDAAYKSSVAQFLNELNSTTTNDLLFHRKAINPRQLEMIIASSELAMQHGFFCVNEPSLDSFLDVPDDWMRDLCKQERLSLELSFPRHTTVDAVIVSEPPNSTPLVGVEFDGESVHTKPKKQENDRIKDAIFLASGIPLIRISSGDLWPSNQRPTENERHARMQFFSQLGKSVAENMGESWWRVDRLHEFLLEEARAIQTENPIVAANIEQYAREMHSLAAKKFLRLAELGEINDFLAEEALQMQQQIADNYRASAPYIAERDDLNDARELLERIGHDPKKWPISHGLEFDYEPHLLPTANGGLTVYVNLTIKPVDCMLTRGGYTEPLSVQSEKVRFRIVCKPELEKRFRAVAVGFLSNRVHTKAIQTLEFRRQRLFDAYRRGVEVLGSG